KLQKTDFYRPEYQKRKDEICPFSSLADFNPLQLTKSPFFQPTTVDKESIFMGVIVLIKNRVEA
ncbi:hypothetical protein RLH48_06540, partial [Streptococcus pneumoniae]|nr:hypothetical protein [Streptococcus pneumoniae]